MGYDWGPGGHYCLGSTCVLSELIQANFYFIFHGRNISNEYLILTHCALFTSVSADVFYILVTVDYLFFTTGLMFESVMFLGKYDPLL